MILLSLLALCLLGNKGCNDVDDDSTDTPAPPEDVAKVVKTGMELSISSIEFAEAMATLQHPPQFDPCMIADGSKAGLNLGISNIPAIEAEAKDPDGKIHLMGGTVDFSRCMTLEGKPEPWPPVAPNPQAEEAVKMGVPLGINVAKMFIEPKIPATGEECIKGRVALAMMDSLSGLITTTVIDGINGAEGTAIPEFDVDYSGCGLTFEKE
jgi:hypothetical protein